MIVRISVWLTSSSLFSMGVSDESMWCHDLFFSSLSSGNIFSTEESFDSAKKTDFLSFRTTFETVIRNHYSRIEGKIAIRFVECRSICIEAINLLNSLSPYGLAAVAHDITHGETLPINAIPIFATSNPNYQTVLTNSVASANKVYQEFLSSKEGKNFAGQVRRSVGITERNAWLRFLAGYYHRRCQWRYFSLWCIVFESYFRRCHFLVWRRYNSR